MAERVTIADVRNAFVCAVNTGAKLLGEGESFKLQEGSPSSGRAWRLYVTGGKWGTGMAGAPLTQDRGYVGWTKVEAEKELTRLAEEYLNA